MKTRAKQTNRTVSAEDRDTIRKLLAYMPFFDQPGLDVGGVHAEWDDNVFRIHPPEYIDELYSFFSLLAPPFTDTDYLSKPIGKWVQHPEFLENASPEQLRTVLTWISRGERFCSGFWEEQLKNGNLMKALRRLHTLQAADFQFDAAASARVQEEADALDIPEPEVIELECDDSAPKKSESA